MSEVQVIGIMLVRNENRFFRHAVANVLDFCDRILVADHNSTDGTYEIAQGLAREHAKLEVRRVASPGESNVMLRPFAGTKTWVLGIDGDEIYDPAGLAATRAELERGTWNEWWVVFGNVLNCTELDQEARTARGYLAPPCRSMTKLYNFAAVEALDPDAPQRLMGRHDRFKPGYHVGLRLDLYKELSWDEARFRCLHACFLPRSTAAPSAAGGRANLTDLGKHSLSRWLQRAFARLTGREASSAHKQAKYMRGPQVTVDASPFFTA